MHVYSWVRLGVNGSQLQDSQAKLNICLQIRILKVSHIIIKIVYIVFLSVMKISIYLNFSVQIVFHNSDINKLNH